MKMPLSQIENAEILAAYEEALSKVNQASLAIAGLKQLLERRNACLSEVDMKTILEMASRASTHVFQVQVQKFKIEQMGWEGREWFSRPAADTTPQQG